MEDPSNTPEQVFRKTKPQKKQLAALQPKTSVQIDSSSQKVKQSAVKVSKVSKKNQKALKKVDSFDVGGSVLKTEVPLAAKPLIDMMGITDGGDSRSLYRSLKRKYLLLEKESFVLAEELEKTELEMKQLQEEKSTLLDELLVLEGLAFNPYPRFEPVKNMESLPLSSDS